MHTTAADLNELNFDATSTDMESMLQVIRQARKDLPTMSREERKALRVMLDSIHAIMAEPL